MFTQDSRKLKLAGSAVGVAGLIYVAFFFGLLGLARWSERRMDAYPYRAEDWLRYQLPTFFADRETDRMMLTGPSSVRENLIYDRFEEAFPETHIRQGAVSMATIEDALLSLRYIKRRFGEEALPDMLVVGISARFVSNIRRRPSPLITSIDQYCPRYRVELTEDGPRLVEKSAVESLWARRHFWSKQQPRFKAGLCSAGLLVMPADVPYSEFGEDLKDLQTLPRSLALVRKIGLRAALGRCLRAYTLPYKYHQLEPRPPKMFVRWMTSHPSVWLHVYRWNPTPDEAAVRRQFDQLLDFAKEHQVKVFVFNTPEHEQCRAQYSTENYEEYLRIVKASIGNTPFVDLREALSANEFYDAVHGTFDGAMHLTDEVIPFLQNNRRMGAEVQR